MKTENDFEEKLKSFTMGTRSKSIENLLNRIFTPEQKQAYIKSSPGRASPPRQVEQEQLQEKRTTRRTRPTLETRPNAKSNTTLQTSESMGSKRSWNRINGLQKHSATMLMGPPKLDNMVSGKNSGKSSGGSKPTPSKHGSNMKILNQMTIHYSPIQPVKKGSGLFIVQSQNRLDQDGQFNGQNVRKKQSEIELRVGAGENVNKSRLNLLEEEYSQLFTPRENPIKDFSIISPGSGKKLKFQDEENIFEDKFNKEDKSQSRIIQQSQKRVHSVQRPAKTGGFARTLLNKRSSLGLDESDDGNIKILSLMDNLKCQSFNLNGSLEERPEALKQWLLTDEGQDYAVKNKLFHLIKKKPTKQENITHKYQQQKANLTNSKTQRSPVQMRQARTPITSQRQRKRVVQDEVVNDLETSYMTSRTFTKFLKNAYSSAMKERNTITQEESPKQNHKQGELLQENTFQDSNAELKNSPEIRKVTYRPGIRFQNLMRRQYLLNLKKHVNVIEQSNQYEMRYVQNKKIDSKDEGKDEQFNSYSPEESPQASMTQRDLIGFEFNPSSIPVSVCPSPDNRSFIINSARQKQLNSIRRGQQTSSYRSSVSTKRGSIDQKPLNSPIQKAEKVYHAYSTQGSPRQAIPTLRELENECRIKNEAIQIRPNARPIEVKIGEKIDNKVLTQLM
ncbi:hypothetical protein FGO68_gene1861 [Halteria grandinella]|uniref:Uncharacterized protein n=1 Tax=Halteria grandinella TaxID=5974 RepID=A0A8J8T732_HALGN|nr:hypothetical protein FGO68_gene1861 [Halteria grandinella]